MVELAEGSLATAIALLTGSVLAGSSARRTGWNLRSAKAGGGCDRSVGWPA